MKRYGARPLVHLSGDRQTNGWTDRAWTCCLVESRVFPGIQETTSVGKLAINNAGEYFQDSQSLMNET